MRVRVRVEVSGEDACGLEVDEQQVVVGAAGDQRVA